MRRKINRMMMRKVTKGSPEECDIFSVRLCLCVRVRVMYACGVRACVGVCCVCVRARTHGVCVCLHASAVFECGCAEKCEASFLKVLI